MQPLQSCIEMLVFVVKLSRLCFKYYFENDITLSETL